MKIIQILDNNEWVWIRGTKKERRDLKLSMIMDKNYREFKEDKDKGKCSKCIRYFRSRCHNHGFIVLIESDHTCDMWEPEEPEEYICDLDSLPDIDWF